MTTANWALEPLTVRVDDRIIVLTPKRYLIMACIVEGLTHAAIAELVSCRPSSVSSSIKQLSLLLDVNGKQAITAWYRMYAPPHPRLHEAVRAGQPPTTDAPGVGRRRHLHGAAAPDTLPARQPGPYAQARHLTVDEQLALYIRQVGEHEVWAGPTNGGTPVVYEGQTQRPVRRVRWERANRDLPPGHIVYATCGSEVCVALDHLTASSPAGRRRINPGAGSPIYRMEAVRTPIVKG